MTRQCFRGDSRPHYTSHKAHFTCVYFDNVSHCVLYVQYSSFISLCINAVYINSHLPLREVIFLQCCLLRIMSAFILRHFIVLEWESFKLFKAIAYKKYIPSCLLMYIEKQVCAIFVFCKASC